MALKTLARRAGGRWSDRRGFTLIELLVVTILIVILAGIALAQYGNSVTRSKEAVLKEDLYRMRDALDQYYADKGKYPPALGSLVDERYLRAVPEDPFTKSSSTWREIMAEPDPRNPSADIGVGDVKSGAEGTSLEGTPYSEW